ncbi:MAG: TonB-dependent receptor plug domain-containing protein [Pseudomonadales bacterium]
MKTISAPLYIGLLIVISNAMAIASADAEDDSSAAIEEVIVDGQKDQDRTAPTLLTEKLLRVPGTLGDPMRAIFSLPGVVEVEDGDGQPAVRGSGPDDNTFLIDFLPTSYVFHDFGNSVFNEHLIRDFGLKAAGFGSRYGQATGAVFDVSLREPLSQDLTTTIDASFLRAGVLLEGRVTENQAFYVSVRESLVHLILEAIEGDEDLKDEEDIEINSWPRSDDYQAKYSWTPNENNRVSLLALGASDRAALSLGSNSDDALIDPGSTGRASLDTKFNSVGLRWDYRDDNNELKTGIGRLQESRRDRLSDGAEFLEIDTTGWTVKSHYTRQLTNAHRVALGGENQRQEFDYAVKLRYQSCSDFDPSCETEPGELLQAIDRQDVATTALFVEDAWQVTPRLLITVGMQWSSDDYLKDSFAEPRIEASLTLTENWRLISSWGKYHQLPEIDQIIPVFGNPQLRSPEATHYVVGTKGEFGDGWSIDLDLYYKDLKNLAVDVDDERNYVNAATGEAYGVELMLQKAQRDRWYGWFALSYAKTRRTNDLTGLTTNADYDTPIVANLVLNYQLRKWNVGLRWNYRSGMPYTPITGNRENPDFPGFYLPVYGKLNSERAGAYHRLDLRAERLFRFSRVEGSYYFDIINVYARRNGGAVAYEPIAGTAEFRLEEEEGLPLIPSLGVKFVF